MISMLLRYKKIIIGVVVIVLLFLAYSVFMPKSTDTSTALTRQDSTKFSGTGTNNYTEGPGTEFVSQLLAIQNIHLDIGIFSDPAYLYLQDFSRELTLQEAGRPNPFAPLGIDGATPPSNSPTANTQPSSNGFVKTSTSTPAAATSTTTTKVPAKSTTKTTTGK